MLPMLVAMVIAGGIYAIVAIGLARNRRELAALQATLPKGRRAPVDLEVKLDEATLPDGTRYWVFVSHGFGAMGQPELVMSVVREAGDVAAEVGAHAMVFFRSIHGAVVDGRHFHAWESGELGVGLFGRADLVGWALIPAEAPEPVAVPAGALTVLLLTRDEAAVARTRGAPSITALLGEHYRHYPIPWWIEPRRASTVAHHPPGALDGAAAFQRGLWTRIGCRGIQVVEPDPCRPGLGMITTPSLDELVVTIDRAAAVPDLRLRLRKLYPDGLMILSTTPAPDAARLVWLPDRPRYGIVGPGGSDGLSGNWIAFGVNDDVALQGASLVEDGFVCALSSSELAALIAALDDGAQAIELAMGPPERRWHLAQAG